MSSDDDVTRVSPEQFEQLLAEAASPGVPNEALRKAAGQARRQIVRRGADIPEEFDGCARACRQPLVHTLAWGECAHAPESARPEPRVTIGGVFTAEDGLPAIGLSSVPVSELAERIERVLRTVPVRFGPNALAMLERGETVGLSGGEYAAMALAVAMDLAGEQS